MGGNNFSPRFFMTPKEKEIEALEQRELREKKIADAQMAYDLANLKMPEDIRARAKVWGMEAWAEILWNNAFQSGYREAMRGKREAPET